MELKSLPRVRQAVRWGSLALLTMPLFQSCTVIVPNPLVIDVSGDQGLLGAIPHLDGDGEDSFLDRLLGFDDDDD